MSNYRTEMPEGANSLDPAIREYWEARKALDVKLAAAKGWKVEFEYMRTVFTQVYVAPSGNVVSLLGRRQPMPPMQPGPGAAA